MLSDDIALEPLAALSDIPGASARLLGGLALAAIVCLVLLLGAVVHNPYAALAASERERVDPVPVSLDVPSMTAGAGSRASDLGLAAVAAARAQLGKPYVWGATGPDTFDCSGLVQWAWARVGVRIPRFTEDQYRALEPVPMDRLEPGTLIFLQHTYPADYTITHVGIYTGSGTVIEAPEPGLAVREVPLGRYAGTHLYGAARPRLPEG